MGCGISKFDIPKGGDPSQLYTRSDSSHSSRHVPMGNASYHKKRGDVEKEEACIDKESSSEGDLNDYDRDDGISYLQSPSFRVYCVPSQLDDGYSEGDSNPEEIMEYVHKGSRVRYGKTNALSRKEKKSRPRCFRRLFQSA